MADTKMITALYVVTDSETPYDNIGDIDGGLFNDEWLENHIKSHGAEGLLNTLTSMITNVVTVSRKIKREQNELNDVVSSA